MAPWSLMGKRFPRTCVIFGRLPAVIWRPASSPAGGDNCLCIGPAFAHAPATGYAVASNCNVSVYSGIVRLRPVVVVVAFSSLAGVLGECSTIYSPPALFFFKWRLCGAHLFHSLGQDHSTVAQRAETIVAECSPTSCV